MKITYLELPDGDKLISYYRHDFKSKKIDDELYFIDGGQLDYIRVGGNLNKCQIKQDKIDDLIEFIRNDYQPLENKYLKDISIYLIKKYLKINKNSVVFIEILKAELKYRKDKHIK